MLLGFYGRGQALYQAMRWLRWEDNTEDPANATRYYLEVISIVVARLCTASIEVQHHLWWMVISIDA
jgi:hypothetical protein